MTVIPQRQLRNEVADVLRRAEAGEVFTVTVNGRPVAQVGPVEVRAPAPGADLERFFADNPADPAWAAELRADRDWERANNPDPWSS